MHFRKMHFWKMHFLKNALLKNALFERYTFWRMDLRLLKNALLKNAPFEKCTFEKKTSVTVQQKKSTRTYTLGNHSITILRSNNVKACGSSARFVPRRYETITVSSCKGKINLFQYNSKRMNFKPILKWEYIKPPLNIMQTTLKIRAVMARNEPLMLQIYE